MDWSVNTENKVEALKMPRCYLFNLTFSEGDDVQLHMFVDANENAYATVASVYLFQQLVSDLAVTYSNYKLNYSKYVQK